MSPNNQTTSRPFPVKRIFSAMLKPCGPTCNLNCEYCYYLHKEGLLGLSGFKAVSDEILERHIRDFIAGDDCPEVVFDWQGGEPTLLGVDFFRKIIAMQKKHCPPSKTVLNNLQTNGTLLTEEWCVFLRENRFLVGLSLDGPKEMHDAYRRDKGGNPTFDRVMASAKLMKKMGVSFNTLTVVNRRNVKYPLDVYRFLTREVGARLIQLIPVVEPKDFDRTAPQRWDEAKLPMVGSAAARPGSPDSVVCDWSADPEDLGAFLCKIFDEWHQRDIGKYHVNLFESAVAVWAGLPPQLCVFSEYCGRAVLVERDGSVYSCDHYVYPEYKLGNVMDKKLADMVYSERQLGFGFNKGDSLPAQCRKCEWLFACRGECPRNRFIKTADGMPGLNYFCTAWKRFFPHANDRLKKLASEVTAGQVRSVVRMEA